MRKICSSTIFRDSDDVVANVTERVDAEGSIIMPLWANICATHPGVVAQSENMFGRRFGMHAMGTVHLLVTPKHTCLNLLVTGHDTLISKNNETTLCHFILEHLDYFIRWLLHPKMQTCNPCSHRFNFSYRDTVLSKE